jgi:ATP-dependent exoDNAse (exonuclease V) alpha subunit
MNKPFELNPDQQAAMAEIEGFLKSSTQHAFVLCGSAGTGKTTLVARIIELASSYDLESMLVAPTGRAARILQNKLNHMLPPRLSGIEVSTLHGAIYYLSRLTVDESRHEDGLSAVQMDFPLKKQGNAFDLLIVDEASMVGDVAQYQDAMRFGSGRLLSDLMTYVQSLYQEGVVARPIKLLFVGDLAQLPPVGSHQSPAISPDYLHQHFGVQAKRYELTQVMRQADGSSILSLANAIRGAISEPDGQSVEIEYNETDVRETDFMSAIDLVADNIRQNRSSAVVVSRNLFALNYNLGVRKKLWGNPYCSVRERDLLLVTRNSQALGLSNGDLVKVHSVLTSQMTEEVRLSTGQFVSLNFREVRLVSGNNHTTQCIILENLLFCSLDVNRRELDSALCELVKQRNPYMDPASTEFQEALLSDPYYNALQVRFGYALTCHKAQGGEWQQVVVDPLGIKRDSEQGNRWLYTAVTRASESLLVVTS